MSKQEEVLMNQNVAPEQFDWDSFESGLNAEDRKEKNELEAWKPALLMTPWAGN